jgi:hypothetical protein
MEENLVFALEGCCSINSQRTGRHLTIQKSWDRDRNVFESIDLLRLRSLTIFGEWEPFFISEKLRLLRVLDLEDAEGVTDISVDQIMKLLPRLKFLSLRGCSDVSCLPYSLGGLLHLQTLDVRNTRVAVLPSTIIKLRKLQYVRAGTIIPSSSDADDGMVDRRKPSSIRGPHQHHQGAVRALPCVARPSSSGPDLWLQFLHLCFEEYQDGKLHFGGKVLAALRVLKITCDGKLRNVRFHQKVLPNLDVLKIHGRRVSSLELSGLKNLRGVLKRVTLTGSCTYAWRVLLSRELFIHLEIFGFPLDDKNCSYWGPAPDYGSDDKDWPGIESHEIDEGPGSLTSVW